jgi:8-oxo-dGTP pyrophosphatase MutT (NUDIX family)
VFLVASYLLGHFVFLIGSAVLDPLYDWARRATEAGDVRRLAMGKRRASAAARLAARTMFPHETDGALRTALRLKEDRLGHPAADGVNAFQWCRAQLMLGHQEALAVVQRFEADSKFFRSLVIVLVAVALVEAADRHVWATIAALAFGILALMRYADQRLKSTNQAYWLLITLHGDELRAQAADRARAQAGERTWTHAGGVVVRSTPGGVEYLLVSAKQRDGWVLPKGHIEPGESPAEAAVREVREEAGTWAAVRHELPGANYTPGLTPIRVAFYLMEYVAAARNDEHRHLIWADFDTAMDTATHEETRVQLRAAHEKMEGAPTAVLV